MLPPVTFQTRAARWAVAAVCAAALATGCATSTPGIQAGGQPSATQGTPSRTASPVTGCAGGTGSADSTWSAPGIPFAVPPLAAVQFVSASQGWVAGAGRIIATGDGGATWTSQYSGPARLVQVDFTDASHGWAVGTSGLLHTSDGGATWRQLAEPCAGRIRSVHFISSSLGYAVVGGSQVRLDVGVPAPVNGGTLVSTGDGGATWQPVAGAPGQAQTACFANQSDGYLGTPGAVWRTTDGGTHWSQSFREPPATGANQPQPDTTVLECAGPSAVWVQFLGFGAALSHAPYLVYATQDGQHWRAVFEESYIETAAHPQVHAPDGPGSYPGPFSAISPDQAAFVGYTPPVGYGAAPLDLASAGGATLASEGNVGGLTRPYATAFVSSVQGWVVGTDQTQASKAGDYAIVATTDGGHSWRTEYRTG